MNQKTLLGHPVGLFILFFTEMWERFSYYGMRAILVLYLISKTTEGGWGWAEEDALILYGWYIGLVYLTPVAGGWIADNKIGGIKAILIGGLLMTLGHSSLAFEQVPTFYLGLLLLILGNGLFKPNVSSLVGQLYPEGSPLKDSGYTIFYMGVNSGAFLGMALCGYLGEKVSWTYGFGAAGIFMLFGLLQFWFGRKIFGDIGAAPKQSDLSAESFGETAVPFTSKDRNGLIATVVLGVVTIFAVLNLERMQVYLAIEMESVLLKSLLVIPFVAAIAWFIVQRLKKYPKVERGRLTVLAAFSFFVVFFWMAFEQQGGSMTIFAKDYTDRLLISSEAITTFRWVSAACTLIPVMILTWVLGNLAVKIMKEYPLTILFTAISFVLIWSIVIWINVRNFQTAAPEVPASWFGTLGSFFIISLAPAFSALWLKLSKHKLNPSGPLKFALGLFFLGVGFLSMVAGAMGIPQGAQAANASMIWLVLAYFFHTVGELCLSPVGLSYVSKLSPKRLVGLMFGVWFIANFVAGFTSGIVGSFMNRITETTSMTNFFAIFVVSSFVVAGIMVLLNKRLKAMMHGIE